MADPSSPAATPTAVATKPVPQRWVADLPEALLRPGACAPPCDDTTGPADLPPPPSGVGPGVAWSPATRLGAARPAATRPAVVAPDLWVIPTRPASPSGWARSAPAPTVPTTIVRGPLASATATAAATLPAAPTAPAVEAMGPLRAGRRLHLGWPVCTASSTAAGVAAIAIADVASRHGAPYGRTAPLFWIGLVLVFAVTAYRALARRTSPAERLALVVLLGAALYIIKILASPGVFTATDEYVHLRNTQDILRTHHLFSFNPLLPTASYYPGLAALTAGLIRITGLSSFVAGTLVIGVARLLLMACLFLIARHVTRSDRAAAGAALVYAANPMFLFWSAAFSYENLALPLAFFVIWWIGRTRGRSPRLAWAGSLVGMGAVIVSHHVAAFVLVGVLGAWWAVERVTGRKDGATRTTGYLALAGAASVTVWFFLVARPAASYLVTNNLMPAVRQTGSLLAGRTHARHLYTSGGYHAPAWQTIAGFAAVGIVLGLLPFGVVRAVRNWRRGPQAVAIVTAVAFPVSLVPRLAPAGVGVSGRSFEYVFAGVGCVLGLLMVRPPRRSGARHLIGPRRGRMSGTRSLPLRPRRRVEGWTLVACVLVTVTFLGDVTIGTAFYQQLPESTHPPGYPWTVQPDATAASSWARGHLGIGKRFASSAIDAQALATYGEENPADENTVWPIFFAPRVNATVVHTIRSTGVDYLFLNMQMTRGIPATPGYYLSPYEPGAGTYKHAMATSDLTKFDAMRCSHFVYRKGSIAILDVAPVQRGACDPAVPLVAARTGASR